jgi:Protein of unknown function (DUF1761)
MKINHLAVLVAALVYFFLGFLWYGIIFAKPWMAMEGITPDTMPKQNVALNYLITFVLNIVVAYALAIACKWRSAGAAKGALIGAAAWVGFVLTTAFPTTLFENRPIGLFCINFGYCLVGFILMGGIIGGWKNKLS